MITEELFQGSGRAVGEVRYSHASDWRWEVTSERKRRSYPELMREYEAMEGGITKEEALGEEIRGTVMDKMVERMKDRVESDEWVEGYVRQILGEGREADEAIRDMRDNGKMDRLKELGGNFDWQRDREEEKPTRYVVGRPGEEGEETVERFVKWYYGDGEEEEVEEEREGNKGGRGRGKGRKGTDEGEEEGGKD
ncbi:hypothetical protein TrRE_jg1474 [Triparma retinervis]|uniref:Uncharacterized protein n=1 Tax=Triparma retinervis TaxID=2557542 RepID=A0A9W7E7L0_9STRA|nr:hypothetical protein TrRE_jg1474 [Triparma retinervis]